MGCIIEPVNEEIINAIFDELRDDIEEVDNAFVWQDSLDGTIDSVNQVFTTTQKFNSNYIRVYENGQCIKKGTDYAIAESVPGTGYDTIIFTEAPESSDSYWVDYKKYSG